MGGSTQEGGPESGSGASPSSHMTFAGRRVGTLVYMAPEQYAGAPVDGRADQFSFAVALWESLYGARPFTGKGAALATAMAAGEITKPPADTTVPRWIEPVLRRALSPRPDDRFSTMDELLAALGRDVERQRRRRLLIGAAVLGVLALGLTAWLGWTRRSAGPPPCSGAETLLAGRWDRAR
ncbi:MAG TPA: protein kinase, partial [Kofleriaceae bacterium]